MVLKSSSEIAFLLCATVLWLVGSNGNAIGKLVASNDYTTASAETVVKTTEGGGCLYQVLEQTEYIIFPNKKVLVFDTNETYDSSKVKFIGDKLCLLESRNVTKHEQGVLKCQKWIYEPDEFTVLKNGSVLVYDEILNKNEYEIHGSYLHTCAPDGTETQANYKISSQKVLIYIGKVGTITSVIALILHLGVFCMVPSLRNLPGYNLASLSLAFLFAYCFFLIGQIEKVLGTACAVAGALAHYFFLAAFFWMNVMAFDVWRVLRLATKKLVSTNSKVRAKKFLLYSIYAWGLPLIITTVSVSLDFTEGVSQDIKPGYGKNDICWINSDSAKLIFFAGPAFMLFVINGIFFLVSAYTIRSNTMKVPGDQQKVAKRNFALYVRLGLIMGVTWSFAVISALLKREELWFIFDILNSLQGLFVFLFFPCSKKVWGLIRKKYESDVTKSTTVQISSTTKE